MTSLETLIAALRAVVREEVEAALAERDRSPVAQHLTVSAFAAAHAISPSTVREAIREGRLDVTRIGRAVRIPAGATIRSRAELDEDATTRAERVLGLIPGGRR